MFLFGFQLFTKKEEMLRHYKWHRKREESLAYGFMRYSASDDCTHHFADCVHNLRQTHYHCLQVRLGLAALPKPIACTFHFRTAATKSTLARRTYKCTPIRTGNKLILPKKDSKGSKVPNNARMRDVHLRIRRTEPRISIAFVRDVLIRSRTKLTWVSPYLLCRMRSAVHSTLRMPRCGLSRPALTFGYHF